jgi:hypothetical protein
MLGLIACDGGTSGDPSDEGSEPTSASPTGSVTSAVGPTYHGDVAPLLIDRCGACHYDGGIAPFSVYDGETASKWASASLAAIDEGRMPPFFAESSKDCEPPAPFLDDPTLSADELQLVRDWVDGGAPVGNPDAAAPITPREPDHLEDPEEVLSLVEPFTVDGDRDIYQCFRIPLPIDEDAWITGLEVLPDNDLVVHHVLVWSDPDDESAGKIGDDGSYRCSGEPDIWPTELVAAWTPGGSPMRAPEDAGTPIHPGGSLVVNVHYHPTGNTTELDQTQIALDLTYDQPSNYVTWYLVDIPFGASVQASDSGERDFLIPANAANHVETVSLHIPDYIPFVLPIFAITPHMHYLGTDMMVTVRSDDEPDEETCLIHTPGYRFDFQTSYVYDADRDDLPTIQGGDTVDVRCTYDNSASNPFIDDQLDAAGVSDPAPVGWGEDTGSEMCMAMVGLILPPIEITDLL